MSEHAEKEQTMTNAEKRAIWDECVHAAYQKSFTMASDDRNMLILEGLRRYPDPKEPTIEDRVNAIPEVKAYRDWQEKWIAEPWTGLRECKDHADAMIDAIHDLIAQEYYNNQPSPETAKL